MFGRGSRLAVESRTAFEGRQTGLLHGHPVDELPQTGRSDVDTDLDGSSGAVVGDVVYLEDGLVGSDAELGGLFRGWGSGWVEKLVHFDLLEAQLGHVETIPPGTWTKSSSIVPPAMSRGM